MRFAIPMFLAVLLVLSACTSQELFPENQTNQSIVVVTIEGNETSEDNSSMLPPEVSEDTTGGSDDLSRYSAVIEVTEGDLVSLQTSVTDPDGDEVTLSYSPPLDENGEWQTVKGDAGEYDVQVVASDGKDETTALVLLRVFSANSAPVIDGPSTIEVAEGETVDLGVLTIIDPDGDDFVVSYSGWMKSSTYRTGFEDAGLHDVTVIAEDTNGNIATKEISVIVTDVNRKPRLRIEDSTIEVIAGETVVIDYTTSDADGDDVTVTFSEPFDENGEWQTKEGDEGEYEVSVIAYDGQDEVERIVKVFVLPANNPPVITVEDELVFDEGETIDLSSYVEVSDPDGDDVTLSYSGWMDSAIRELTFEDAGEYVVTITATDGDKTTTKDVRIVVNNVNRPPVFIWP